MTFRAHSQANDAGYTLLELLVVVTLLGMMAVAVTIWLPDISDRVAVERTANVIERRLSEVAAAVARSGYDQTVTLVRQKSSLALHAGNLSIALDPRVQAKWTAAREAGSDSGQGSIMFLGLGGASGGTFELTSGRAQAVVEVDWLTASVRRRK